MLHTNMVLKRKSVIKVFITQFVGGVQKLRLLIADFSPQRSASISGKIMCDLRYKSGNVAGFLLVL
jgi:hypothetical protein